MLNESLAWLITDLKGIYVDATLGMGGYSEFILDRTDPQARVFGFDVDTDAIDKAGERLASHTNFSAVQANFSQVKVELFRLGIREISGIVFDLGVSSLMLDDGEKGFSYRFDGPLDMRMDRSLEIRAEDILNGWEKDDLRRLFLEYGEERQAGKIASIIVKERQKHRLSRTGDITELLKKHIPEPYLNKSLSRIFQALRIEVNDELGNLKKALEQSVDLLAEGGRLVVVSYHSLEDRIVKDFMKLHSTDCICPPKLPVCTCGHHADLKILTRRIETAGKAEVAANVRSRSARLRAAEKIAPVQSGNNR